MASHHNRDLARAVWGDYGGSSLLGSSRFMVQPVLQNATRTIPLDSMSEDLVGEGFAASLARLGGNITGVSLLSPELDGKRLEILIEAVPGLRRMAALAHPSKQHLDELQELAVEHLKELAPRCDHLIRALLELQQASKGGGTAAEG